MFKDCNSLKSLDLSGFITSNYTDDFEFNSYQFEEDIYAKEPAVVYICNPNNPTGNLHPISYIEHLLNEFPDTLFLIDEAYYEFSGVSAKDLVLRYENILISRTMSKAFGIANFRVGYLIASKDNIQFINKIRNPKNLSTIAQTAAMAVLSDLDYMWNYVSEVRETRDYFIDSINKLTDRMKPYSSNGNFVLIKMKSREEKMEVINYLIENNIFVRDTTQNASVYNCFRITIGNREQMERVLSILKTYYER